MPTSQEGGKHWAVRDPTTTTARFLAVPRNIITIIITQQKCKRISQSLSFTGGIIILSFKNQGSAES
jgi:hypothetical protein